MLAFFDSSIEKKEDEQIDLGLSALSALLHINHASWINSEEIIHIRKKLLDIFTTKTYNEVQELFDNFSQDKEKQNSLKITLRVIYLVKNHTNKIDN